MCGTCRNLGIASIVWGIAFRFQRLGHNTFRAQLSEPIELGQSFHHCYILFKLLVNIGALFACGTYLIALPEHNMIIEYGFYDLGGTVFIWHIVNFVCATSHPLGTASKT